MFLELTDHLLPKEIELEKQLSTPEIPTEEYYTRLPMFLSPNNNSITSIAISIDGNELLCIP